MNVNKNAWDELHESYSETDWIDRPNIFAEQIWVYLPLSGKVLDIGAGQGQDSRFFVSKGYEVTSLDVSGSALKAAKAKMPPEFADKLKIVGADITLGLPVPDASFDIVYAHLSLHYFDTKTTDTIFQEISRALKRDGIFAFFVNSTTDPECGEGDQIEKDFYYVQNKTKRYFSIESARKFADKYFEEIIADDNGETYKDSDKGIHNLVRYVGKKKSEP